VAQTVLSMYDLAPVDERVQVDEALDEVRPYIHSHGGEVELLDVEDGVVHLRLSGSCHGCAASAMTLKRGIEEVLRKHYPGFKEVVSHEPEGDPEPAEGQPKLLQIEDLRRPVFVDAGAAEEVPEGTLRPVVVDDIPILLAHVGGELYAFKNGCVVDGLPLEGGRLTDTVIVCPWHNCAYDARSGKRVDEPDQPGLAVVPIAVQDGAVRVAVNVA
jgi:Fe-S cluster biogenesis protein NfuA/nitrite reductase/ring-hydroxylating ferredoxin subunit